MKINYIAKDIGTNVVDGNYKYKKDAEDAAMYLTGKWKGSKFVVDEQHFPGLCVGNIWHNTKEGEEILIKNYGYPK